MTETDVHRYATRRTIQTFAVIAIVYLMVLCCMAGCVPFTLSDINAGVSAGRKFDDSSVFATGSTTWNVTISGHYVRDKQ